MSVKKISIYLPNLSGGGAEHVAIRIANALAARGENVDLVLSQVKGPHLNKVCSKVNIIDLNCNGRFTTLKSLPKLLIYLKNKKPDVIFSTLFRANVIAALALKFSGIKARLVIRHPNMLYPQGNPSETIYTSITKKLAIRAAQSADLVVLTSQMMKDELLSLASFDEKKVKIIYNPVPTDDIQIKASVVPKHYWFEGFENKGKSIILSVGRLNVQKNYSNLINSFALVKKNIDARLIILGEGEERGKLEKLANDLGVSDSVSMPGFVDNPYAYMSRADVFVLPSLWEGFPNVLVEAMACNTSVIATDCPGGTSEILENGMWGILVKNNNIDDLSKAIQRGLMTSQPILPIDRVASFSPEKVVDEFIELMIEK